MQAALGSGLGSGPPTGYREGCAAHSTDTEPNKIPTASTATDLQGFVRAVFSLGTDRKSDIPIADSSLSTVGISVARNIDRAGILAFAGVSYSVDRLQSMRSMFCALSCAPYFCARGFSDASALGALRCMS
jgi:hypothetical protein